MWTAWERVSGLRRQSLEWALAGTKEPAHKGEGLMEKLSRKTKQSKKCLIEPCLMCSRFGQPQWLGVEQLTAEWQAGQRYSKYATATLTSGQTPWLLHRETKEEMETAVQRKRQPGPRWRCRIWSMLEGNKRTYRWIRCLGWRKAKSGVLKSSDFN